jgi:hypothetical protein
MLSRRSARSVRWGAISLRRFVTLEMALHGPLTILAELAAAVSLYTLAGSALLWRGATRLVADAALGGFFLGVALNYATLLLYALVVWRERRLRGKVPLAPEREGPSLQWRALQLALLPLLPLACPVLALYQELTAFRHGVCSDRWCSDQPPGISSRASTPGPPGCPLADSPGSGGARSKLSSDR